MFVHGVVRKNLDLKCSRQTRACSHDWTQWVIFVFAGWYMVDTWLINNKTCVLHCLSMDMFCMCTSGYNKLKGLQPVCLLLPLELCWPQWLIHRVMSPLDWGTCFIDWRGAKHRAYATMICRWLVYTHTSYILNHTHTYIRVHYIIVP